MLINTQDDLKLSLEDSLREQEALKKIKRNIDNSYEVFKTNADMYTRCINFIFVKTIDNSSRAANNMIQRPSLEFNVLESSLSRQCGEFVNNEPNVTINSSSIVVNLSDEEKKQRDELIRVLSGYWRHVLYESNKRNTEYYIFRDILGGGYSSRIIYTEYLNEKSMQQVIRIDKTFDQTLVGFDPLATNHDKSDGLFCYQIFPMRKDDFERQFSDYDLSSLNFDQSFTNISQAGGNTFGPFNWTFKTGNEKIIMVAEYYEKVVEKKKLLQLSNGEIILEDEYEELLKEWKKYPLLGKPPVEEDFRYTDVVTIERYRLIQNHILTHEETSYRALPIKFVDGNSIVSKDDTTGSCHQLTRPFYYNAQSAQMLKNFTGSVLAQEIENTRPAQIVVSLEAMPNGYETDYRQPQNSTVLPYNAFLNGDPAVRLDPPMPIQRAPISPELINTFMATDQIIANILGSTGPTMSQMTEAQMSGKAIQEVISSSNSAVMPYYINYLRNLESTAQMVIDMFPLYHQSPMTLPIIDEKGKHSSVLINSPGGVKIEFEPGDFKVEIEPGISFQQQQDRTLQQMTGMANAIPSFGEFVNEQALDLIVENMRVRRSDELLNRTEGWMRSRQQARMQAEQASMNQPSMEAQAMQIAAQQVQSEAQVGMARVAQQAESEQVKAQLKLQEIELEKEKLKVEVAKIIASMRVEEEKLGIAQQKADDERINTVIDAAIKQSVHVHGLAHKHHERDMDNLAFQGKETKQEESEEKKATD